MAGPKIEIDEYNAPIIERLRKVVESMSQRELSRRTGVSNQNINRYLHGAKPPAWFCSRLVEALGINAEWLLTGKGKMHAAALSQAASGAAEEMAELLKAINSIAQRSYRTLAGEETLASLKSLNNSLQQLEDIKASFSSQLEPVIRHLLGNLRTALGQMEDERTATLISSLDRAFLIHDDVRLKQEFHFLKAFNAHREGDYETLESLLYAMISGFVATRTAPDEEACCRLLEFFSGMLELLRFESGARLCDAYLRLMEGKEETWLAFHELRSSSAQFNAETENLHKALEQVQRSQVALRDSSRSELYEYRLQRILFLSGLASFDDVAKALKPTPLKLSLLCDIALWNYDLAQVEHVCAEYETVDTRPLESQELISRSYARAMRIAIAPKSSLTKALKELDSTTARIPNHPFTVAVTPIVRALIQNTKKPAEATGELLAHFAHLEKTSHTVPPIIFRAIAHRLVIQLSTTSASKMIPLDVLTNSHQFMDRLKLRGYNGLLK